MLALAPELRDAVLLLRVNRASGTDGQLDEIEAAAARFAALSYRHIGKDPKRASVEARAIALEDMHGARRELVNAVQALYMATRRESRLKAVDAATRAMLDATDAYIGSARRALMRLRLAPDNLYEPGRGFPRPFELRAVASGVRAGSSVASGVIGTGTSGVGYDDSYDVVI
jgi:hypothetical protein